MEYTDLLKGSGIQISMSRKGNPCDNAQAEAVVLGLSGEVDPQILARFFAGFAPDGQRALTQNVGSSHRCCGWDMTASACKGFSVLWSQADEETRRALSGASGKNASLFGSPQIEEIGGCKGQTLQKKLRRTSRMHH